MLKWSYNFLVADTNTTAGNMTIPQYEVEFIPVERRLADRRMHHSAVKKDRRKISERRTDLNSAAAH